MSLMIPRSTPRAGSTHRATGARLALGISFLTLLACGDTAGPSFNALTVTTSDLENGVEDVAYADTLVATGGDGSYSWSVSSGILPAGLTLDAPTGEISGTPTGTGGGTSFTIQVSSGDSQTATADLSISVAIAPRVIPTNGPDLAGRTSYYLGNLVTTGAYLTLQIFDDNTGRIAYDNDAFQPPTGLSTRTLYDFTATQTPPDVLISFQGEQATLGNVRNVVALTSFEADYDDGTNQTTLTFLYFSGGDPPR